MGRNKIGELARQLLAEQENEKPFIYTDQDEPKGRKKRVIYKDTAFAGLRCPRKPPPPKKPRGRPLGSHYKHLQGKKKPKTVTFQIPLPPEIKTKAPKPQRHVDPTKSPELTMALCESVTGIPRLLILMPDISGLDKAEQASINAARSILCYVLREHLKVKSADVQAFMQIKWWQVLNHVTAAEKWLTAPNPIKATVAKREMIQQVIATLDMLDNSDNQ